MPRSEEILSPETGMTLAATDQDASAARFWRGMEVCSLVAMLFGTVAFLHEIKVGGLSGEAVSATAAALGALGMYMSGPMADLYRQENLD